MSTRKPVIDWATDFDYLDPEWAENPYPIWDGLRSMTVALEEWLGNIPEFSLAVGGNVQWSEGAIRGPRQLPLTIGSTKS